MSTTCTGAKASTQDAAPIVYGTIVASSDEDEGQQAQPRPPPTAPEEAARLLPSSSSAAKARQSSYQRRDSSVRVISVQAPSELPGGYEFWVNAADGHSVKVQVPDGGVMAGQTFDATVVSQKLSRNNVILWNDHDNNAVVQHYGDHHSPHEIPVGDWRDGLCDCCVLGSCHPLCCLAFWCHACVLGQLLTRMKLNWCGDPLSSTMNSQGSSDVSPHQPRTRTGRSACQLYVYLTIAMVLVPVAPVQTTLALLVLIVTMKLRHHVRTKYNIPERSCHGCEDCCCAFWCTSCTLCQMGRHTANYRYSGADCCTETGLPSGAPDVV